MSRAQDVLDYIDALEELAERRSSFPAAERNKFWQLGGVQFCYCYDKSSHHHLRITSAELLT